jgi:hypothetical protein
LKERSTAAKKREKVHSFQKDNIYFSFYYRQSSGSAFFFFLILVLVNYFKAEQQNVDPEKNYYNN